MRLVRPCDFSDFFHVKFDYGSDCWCILREDIDIRHFLADMPACSFVDFDDKQFSYRCAVSLNHAIFTINESVSRGHLCYEAIQSFTRCMHLTNASDIRRAGLLELASLSRAMWFTHNMFAGINHQANGVDIAEKIDKYLIDTNRGTYIMLTSKISGLKYWP